MTISKIDFETACAVFEIPAEQQNNDLGISAIAAIYQKTLKWAKDTEIRKLSSAFEIIKEYIGQHPEHHNNHFILQLWENNQDQAVLNALGLPVNIELLNEIKQYENKKIIHGGKPTERFNQLMQALFNHQPFNTQDFTGFLSQGISSVTDTYMLAIKETGIDPFIELLGKVSHDKSQHEKNTLFASSLCRDYILHLAELAHLYQPEHPIYKSCKNAIIDIVLKNETWTKKKDFFKNNRAALFNFRIENITEFAISYAYLGPNMIAPNQIIFARLERDYDVCIACNSGFNRNVDMTRDFQDACAVLSIPANEWSTLTEKKIQKKYKQMALLYHPDKVILRLGANVAKQQIEEETLRAKKAFEDISQATDIAIEFIKAHASQNENNTTKVSVEVKDSDYFTQEQCQRLRILLDLEPGNKKGTDSLQNIFMGFSHKPITTAFQRQLIESIKAINSAEDKAQEQAYQTLIKYIKSDRYKHERAPVTRPFLRALEDVHIQKNSSNWFFYFLKKTLLEIQRFFEDLIYISPGIISPQHVRCPEFAEHRLAQIKLARAKDIGTAFAAAEQEEAQVLQLLLRRKIQDGIVGMHEPAVIENATSPKPNDSVKHPQQQVKITDELIEDTGQDQNQPNITPTEFTNSLLLTKNYYDAGSAHKFQPTTSTAAAQSPLGSFGYDHS